MHTDRRGRSGADGRTERTDGRTRTDGRSACGILSHRGRYAAAGVVARLRQIDSERERREAEREEAERREE